MDSYFLAIREILEASGFAGLTGGHLTMITVSLVMLYLAIGKGFEPLLLVPIGFGCLSG